MLQGGDRNSFKAQETHEDSKGKSELVGGNACNVLAVL